MHYCCCACPYQDVPLCAGRLTARVCRARLQRAWTLKSDSQFVKSTNWMAILLSSLQSKVYTRYVSSHKHYQIHDKRKVEQVADNLETLIFTLSWFQTLTFNFHLVIFRLLRLFDFTLHYTNTDGSQGSRCSREHIPRPRGGRRSTSFREYH